MVSTLSEFVGISMAIVSVDRVGRIYTQVVGYLTGAVMVLVLGLLATYDPQTGTGPSFLNNVSWGLVVTAFIARMMLEGAASITPVSTAELYSTNIRATANSVANFFSRLGSFASPFLVASSKMLSFAGVGGVLCAVVVGTEFSAWMLPETMGLLLGTALVHDMATDDETDEESREDEPGRKQCDGINRFSNQSNTI